MKIYLGLGSNLGDYKTYFQSAIEKLRAHGLEQIRVSPIYESPALLPEKAPDNWNLLFHNCVLEANYVKNARELLVAIKIIEQEMGRSSSLKWSPRIIDIDILLFGDQIISEAELKVPHPELTKRAFVLDPLKDLNPLLTIPDHPECSVLQLARFQKQHSPLWMAILNITPDSFSDGGIYNSESSFLQRVQMLVGQGAQILDLGAMSTRPNAEIISAKTEWERLRPMLELLQLEKQKHPFFPKISVDSYRPEVAAQAIEYGADIINDVSGLESEAMLDLVKQSGKEFVVMHSLSVPADKQKVIDTAVDPVKEVQSWLQKKLILWEQKSINPSQIIFDPGIGFGKTAIQSLDLMKNIREFLSYPLRVLVGHSRKSFMNNFCSQDFANRDLETIGASLQLIHSGVDILRVHNVEDHLRSFRAWSHCR